MSGLLEGIVDPQYVDAVSWIIIAGIAIVLVYAAYRIVRLLTSGTFISGGRNRRTRLAVMDATAVDDKRRLVLVRRDDVEHLILIGGPTDLVVEQDIRMIQKPARPLPSEQTLASEPAETAVDAPRVNVAAAARPQYRESRPNERPPAPRPTGERNGTTGARPTPVATVSTPPAPPQATAPQPARPGSQPAANQSPAPAAAAPVAPPPSKAAPEPRVAATPAPSPRPEPARTGFYASFQNRPGQPTPAPTRMPVPPSAAPVPTAKPAAAPMSASEDDELDQALLQELEDSLDLPSGEKASAADRTLDDEMSKLFGELARDRKQVN